MTARWVVDDIAPQRDFNIIWQPISLLKKNDPSPDSEYFDPVHRTHRLLRVMEAIRADLGDDAVFAWYWQCGTRIHHDEDREFDVAEALEHIGYDTKFAAAYDDEKWDTEIERRMQLGLDLVGDDVGTPIIAFKCDDGVKRGIFGPVITKVPGGEQSQKVWDAMEAFATMEDFWELKRTRTKSPEFGTRPDV